MEREPRITGATWAHVFFLFFPYAGLPNVMALELWGRAIPDCLRLRADLLATMPATLVRRCSDVFRRDLDGYEPFVRDYLRQTWETLSPAEHDRARAALSAAHQRLVPLVTRVLTDPAWLALEITGSDTDRRLGAALRARAGQDADPAELLRAQYLTRWGAHLERRGATGRGLRAAAPQAGDRLIELADETGLALPQGLLDAAAALPLTATIGELWKAGVAEARTRAGHELRSEAPGATTHGVTFVEHVPGRRTPESPGGAEAEQAAPAARRRRAQRRVDLARERHLADVRARLAGGVGRARLQTCLKIAAAIFDRPGVSDKHIARQLHVSPALLKVYRRLQRAHGWPDHPPAG
jgi:hypothetical protein